ncbi:uncharacterized protein LOC131933809 [Physella acuta]|uniref:uncharacterized protein LOC131933809 n=1 Tax=Physella acuta TaxID=109671 RepID=UPI0027DB619D|nr:uncharacterized protein LOC131933809 [Physella acuta]
MTCNWTKLDYFSQLMSRDPRSFAALEMLVDDLHAEKERTISTFLSHSGLEDFLWGLVRLIGNETTRVAGNAAYILGTLAESEIGCYRILSLAKRNEDKRIILKDLTRMLTFHDPESVMNAAGTLGTLAESVAGREWMLSDPSVDDMLNHVTMLLSADNLWTASNAALVLARLCISEKGCQSILKHTNSKTILTRLISALGVDEAGRGMNAAFAIGRLCDMDSGRQRLLAMPDCEKMISSLAKMLSCTDTGASKNACFALSCLATNLDGHGRLLNNFHCETVVKTLSQLLSTEDDETGWFAAMTLRTLASQPKGCLKLREFPQVLMALKKIDQLKNVNSDLKDEVILTLEILKHLERPEAPSITVLGPTQCDAVWTPVETKSGFDVQYQLYEGNTCCYTGPACQFEVQSLTPNTTYHFKVRATTQVDISEFSDVTKVTTDEDFPEAPQNVRVIGVTATQLKICWESPEKFNGTSKGYYVYQGKNMLEHTSELSAIISGLTANTTYELQVCAATYRGKGPKSSCLGTTAELGAHAPSKPTVQVLGRNEMHVSWEAPVMPLGRINHYDVSMNGKVIYSGTELSCGSHRLTPDTEYTFTVIAVTNEGRFESKPTKKKTAKDEFEPVRTPLYQPPKKEEEPPKPKLQKKRKTVVEPKVHSTKISHAMCHPQRPVSAGCFLNKADKTKEEKPIQKSDQKLVNTKQENNRPRTHKDVTRSHKAPSPVTISYISIQGDNFDSVPSAQSQFPNRRFTRSPNFHTKSNQTFRFERSKTTLIPSRSLPTKQIKNGKLSSNSYIDLSQYQSLEADPDISNGLYEHLSAAKMSGEVNMRSTWSPQVSVVDASRRYSEASDSPVMSRSAQQLDISSNGDVDSDTSSTKWKRSDSNTLFYTRACTPQDSQFLMEQNSFMQRANTFTRSHRPGQTKIDVSSMPLSLLEPSTLALQRLRSVSQSTSNGNSPLRNLQNNSTSMPLQRMKTSISQPNLGLPSHKLGSLLRSQTQVNLQTRP